ncbi:DUF3039 domain-containing protein [Microbacterium sp. YY-01]|uniref:DUF3039 domain-containing protein n=1 Tax=Microbacterium sp. YY-01 TaxID=3421634 RepID=UPI003D166833
MTDVLERTDTKQISNDGDHDRFAHYFKKRDLDAALLEGKPATALCGKVEPKPFRGIDGRTVCPTCKEIYEGIPE